MSLKRYKNKANITKAYLEDIAEVIDVHPRTILRTITANPTEYWAPSHNPRIHLTEVSKTFQTPTKSLVELLQGKDRVIRPAEAAELLGVSVRTIRNKSDEYRPLIIGAGFLRFSYNEVQEWGERLKSRRRDKISKMF